MSVNVTYSTERKISSAYLDSSVRLGISHTAKMIQDNVTECFGSFSCDGVTYEQKVRYSLIDMSHHVNNTEYINLALDVFTEEYLLANPIKELEVHYTGETKEGETLKIYKCTKDSRTYVQIKVEDRLVFECYFLF